MLYKGQSIGEIAERVNIVRCIVVKHFAMPFDPEPELGVTKPFGGEFVMRRVVVRWVVMGGFSISYEIPAIWCPFTQCSPHLWVKGNPP